MKKPILIALDKMSDEEKELAEALGYIVVDKDLEALINIYHRIGLKPNENFRCRISEAIINMVQLTLEADCIFVKGDKRPAETISHRNCIYLANMILYIAYAMRIKIVTKQTIYKLAASKLTQTKREEVVDQNEQDCDDSFTEPSP